MKLQYGSNSPFVRKVAILIEELGLTNRVERVPVTLSPYEPDATVTALNPLGKIPVLIAEDGQALFDSIVICEYLCSVARDTEWFPPTGPARWAALRNNAVADGMLEAGQAMRLESLRPEQVRYATWIDAQRLKVERSFDFFERNVPSDHDIGGLAAVSAIGWIDYRLPELHWRDKSPTLAKWVAAMEQRSSIFSTRHG